jgi:hypothetical protein
MHLALSRDPSRNGLVGTFGFRLILYIHNQLYRLSSVMYLFVLTVKTRRGKAYPSASRANLDEISAILHISKAGWSGKNPGVRTEARGFSDHGFDGDNQQRRFYPARYLCPKETHARRNSRIAFYGTVKRSGSVWNKGQNEMVVYCTRSRLWDDACRTSWANQDDYLE